MAKSTKHKDSVKPFDEFRAPWETADGSEAEIDKPKLKRYIYGLVTDKANAQDAREDALADVEAITAERDEAKEQAANANPAEAQKQIDKLTKQVADLTAERDGLVKDKERSDLRAKVLEGVDPKIAKYVQGETEEELEESLKAVKADFGVAEEKDDDEDEDREEQVRTRPRSRLRNGADPEAGKTGSDEVDFDKIADGIVGNGIFG